MKCVVIEGSVVNGIREPKSFSFILDQPSGYKVFCEPETMHFKRSKSVLITITFYLEDDNHEQFNFNNETLNFTLQMTKIF